ncbi:MAG: sigma-54-dependent Fis family transcriptional regulator [candidate division Zixibacteria bacterium]|nr:sigma-54-dependent Fis family transcriptional regulator [candidate division Zixibacteria bacterium]
MPSILIVDDDQILCSTLTKLLSGHGYDVAAAGSAEEADKLLGQTIYDLVVTDLRLPGRSGIDIIKNVKATMPDTELVMLTGHGSIDSAVEAMKLGAGDYLTKPFQDEELLLVIEKALHQQKLKNELKHLKRAFAETFNVDNIIGTSPAIKKIVDIVKQIAPQDISVLITGGSGTGKELFAKAIHNNSPRAECKFVAINCSAMPDLLLESELFGHVKGAFTSAAANKKGLFEEADGGTIFLDEVGDMSPSLQAKLLRVLQEEEIRPVGSNQTNRINVRVIAATNKALESLVAQNRFREDLYYRLNVISLKIPPLAERCEDIVPLAHHFLRKYCRHFKKTDMTLTQAACDKLVTHNWPGNVRELENTIKRAVALSISDTIDVANLFLMEPVRMRTTTTAGDSIARGLSLAEMQQQHILRSLKENNWNYSLTASKLGIGRTTLWRKVKKFNLAKS